MAASGSFEFLAKVEGIPLVKSVLAYAGQKYSSLKESNCSYTKLAIDKLEKTGAYTAAAAGTYLAAYRKPLLTLDKKASMALDAVERVVPALKMSPQQLSNASKKVYESRVVAPVQEANQRIKNAVTGLLTTIQTVADERIMAYIPKYKTYVATSVNKVLAQAANLLDMYAPKDSKFQYPADKMAADSTVQQTIDLLSRKLMVSVAYNTSQLATALGYWFQFTATGVTKSVEDLKKKTSTASARNGSAEQGESSK